MGASATDLMVNLDICPSTIPPRTRSRKTVVTITRPMGCVAPIAKIRSSLPLPGHQ
jgi:hypothetical protein